MKHEGKTRRKRRRRRGMFRGDRNKTYLSIHAPQFTNASTYMTSFGFQRIHWIGQVIFLF